MPLTNPSNLPPGVTDADIENQQGADSSSYVVAAFDNLMVALAKTFGMPIALTSETEDDFFAILDRLEQDGIEQGLEADRRTS